MNKRTGRVKQSRTPFPARADQRLTAAGYKRSKLGDFYTKTNKCTVVLKNKRTLETFRGFHHQVAGLLVQDGSVYPLSALDILNVKEIV